MEFNHGVCLAGYIQPPFHVVAILTGDGESGKTARGDMPTHGIGAECVKKMETTYS